jgi:hypothetical protein
VFSGIRDLFIHPDLFFERVSKEKVNLVPPLAIIGAGAIVTLIPYIIALLYYALTAPNNMSYVGWMGLIQVFFKTFVVCPLLIWGVISFCTYGISRGLNGKGSLAIQNTGYGMIPWSVSVIASVVLSGILFIIAYIAPTGIIPIEAYSPIEYSFFYFIGIIALFWQLYLWILAVKHTHGFTFRKAATVTIIPVVIVICLTIPMQAWINTIGMVVSGL